MYAIVDIETTGGYAANHRITEVAIYHHDGIHITDRFHTLINPERNIPYYITGLTGITTEMVLEAPSFKEVADDIFKHCFSNVTFSALLVCALTTSTVLDVDLYNAGSLG